MCSDARRSRLLVAFARRKWDIQLGPCLVGLPKMAPRASPLIHKWKSSAHCLRATKLTCWFIWTSVSCNRYDTMPVHHRTLLWRLLGCLFSSVNNTWSHHVLCFQIVKSASRWARVCNREHHRFQRYVWRLKKKTWQRKRNLCLAVEARCLRQNLRHQMFFLHLYWILVC